ncbi:hypothetical protein EV421DRAFT_1906739 [Armillaria borealis]|uniref:Uncharacterized protein n=1 Tax=Armillaria borealis TaxID=47425 RepID=A0AA39MLL3_9AGAR|nr:hypothetical protein EV421DRAFT_1906739 [Armillaria borealis]
MQLAELGGQLPEALGYWLWQTFPKGSAVRNWHRALPQFEQARLRTHVSHFLAAIKDNFLSITWERDMQDAYRNQRFHQRGHERESLQEFINRRAIWTRVLIKPDDGGPLEVELILKNVPVAWLSTLQADSIRSMVALYKWATDNEKKLISEARREQFGLNTSISADQLIPVMRRLGVTMSRVPPREVHTIGREEEDPIVEEEDSPESRMAAHSQSQGCLGSSNYEEQSEALREAYQVFKKWQRPLPKGGYPFPRHDEVTTKLGRAPPSPCKVCGSPHHWDKECPDWNTYLKLPQNHNKTARVVSLDSYDHDDAVTTYESAYEVLLTQRVASITSSEGALDFERVAQSEVKDAIGATLPLEHKTLNDKPIPRENPSSSMYRFVHRLETVEDDEKYTGETRNKSLRYVVEDPWSEDEDSNKERAEVNNTDSEIPKISPTEDKPFRLKARCKTKAGKSAADVSVLSHKGWVGHLKNPMIDLRNDSCADISLISEDFYNSLLNPPPLCQGEKLRLWQLTDGDNTIKGFVHITVLFYSEHNRLIETTVEAYVVPGMTVPLLLGEDYAQNYEIGVTRNLEEGTKIHYGDTGVTVQATPVDRTADFKKVRKSMYSSQSFVKAKAHRRNRNLRNRR